MTDALGPQHDALLSYYEEELQALRHMGAAFARDYPKIARRLQLEDNTCADPHVERLLEGFAFLAARTRLRIDDDFPEFSEGLLEILAPHHVRPIPSLSLVQFRQDTAQDHTSAHVVRRGSMLFYKQDRPPIGGLPETRSGENRSQRTRAKKEDLDEKAVRYRTCYDTSLWPVQISEVKWGTPQALAPNVPAGEAVAALAVTLDAGSGSLSKLAIPELRLFLDAEAGTVGTLYELLLSRCAQIYLYDPERPSETILALGASSLRPVGFEANEGLIPFPSRTPLAHRLLLEYFAFPEKFHFLDLGFRHAFERDGLQPFGGFGQRGRIVFLIKPHERPERSAALETSLRPENLKLGCTPIVNLFVREAEPIPLRERRSDYLVQPDGLRKRETWVFSVDKVDGVSGGRRSVVPFTQLYSIGSVRGGDEDHVFWSTRRRTAERRVDSGTEILVTFSDRSGVTRAPDLESAVVSVTCHNGPILPSLIDVGRPEGDFDLDKGAAVKAVVTLRKPTGVLEPRLGGRALWTLVSQVALNMTSLAAAGGEGLRELLGLHDRSNSSLNRMQIDGIVDLRTRPTHARVKSSRGIAFARGHEVTVTLDERRFTGSSAYLFSAVLEHFFGLSVSVNSFTALRVVSEGRHRPLAEFRPRSGSKVLL